MSKHASIAKSCSRAKIERAKSLLENPSKTICVRYDKDSTYVSPNTIVNQVYSIYPDCSCENKRIMEISQDLGHRPIVFIRFNPDEYNKNGK